VGAVGRRSAHGPVGITVTRASVVDGVLDASVRYDLDGRSWDQPFSARVLDESAIRGRLAAVGLRLDSWLDASRGWFVARR
jgi:hypothetical protein